MVYLIDFWKYFGKIGNFLLKTDKKSLNRDTSKHIFEQKLRTKQAMVMGKWLKKLKPFRFLKFRFLTSFSAQNGNKSVKIQVNVSKNFQKSIKHASFCDCHGLVCGST